MALSREGHIDVAVTPDQALGALRDVFASLSRPESVSVDGWTVTATVGTSWRTWGELLSGRVLTGPGGTRVEVRSASRLRTQVLDWGKHRKNLDAILGRLEQQLGRA